MIMADPQPTTFRNLKVDDEFTVSGVAWVVFAVEGRIVIASRKDDPLRIAHFAPKDAPNG
jgi:hypothetical protein